MKANGENIDTQGVLMALLLSGIVKCTADGIEHGSGLILNSLAACYYTVKEERDIKSVLGTQPGEYLHRFLREHREELSLFKRMVEGE